MIRWATLSGLLRRSAEEHRARLELADRAAKFGIVPGLDEEPVDDVRHLLGPLPTPCERCSGSGIAAPQVPARPEVEV